MIDAISTLLEAEFAYSVENDIYFDISKDKSFGSFSGFSKKLQLAFMAIRGGDPERPGKRNALDFLLWKGVNDSNDPARWDSPFGFGRPGWHIECSVMSKKLLGTPFDLHGGGTDLIFPHHECEIAQSYGMSDMLPVRHWMHVSPMLLDGEKMSKSLGNLIFATDLLKDYDFATIRLALMHYHHRIAGEWQPEFLKRSKEILSTFHKRATQCSKSQAEVLIRGVRAALDEDLNTEEVINILNHFNSSKNYGQPTNSDAAALIQKTLFLLGLTV
jgi:L-cysteine:1D-myo-inositol 2-amino-2-deoxy-alpha-D-glucopyranoside ligase